MTAVFGPFDRNVKEIEKALHVTVSAVGSEVFIRGDEKDCARAKEALETLKVMWSNREPITDLVVCQALDMSEEAGAREAVAVIKDVITFTAKGRPVKCRTLGQRNYVKAIADHPVTICIGPAGTGKTYLAIAMAVKALKNEEIERIILTRPAVEAGEHLGFLPGDLQSKVDPYLRPLYDGLFEMLGEETFHRYLDRGIIEVAPLAYMRGRTLNDAFIILDEAQNTTSEQMKMFLTRMGMGSKMVITGDVTQIDLPVGKRSGLVEALEVLKGVPDIGIVQLTHRDVVRHELVQAIVRAYEKHAQKNERNERQRRVFRP